jgi:hypothetical protein
MRVFRNSNEAEYLVAAIEIIIYVAMLVLIGSVAGAIATDERSVLESLMLILSTLLSLWLFFLLLLLIPDFIFRPQTVDWIDRIAFSGLLANVHVAILVWAFQDARVWTQFIHYSAAWGLYKFGIEGRRYKRWIEVRSYPRFYSLVGYEISYPPQRDISELSSGIEPLLNHRSSNLPTTTKSETTGGLRVLPADSDASSLEISLTTDPSPWVFTGWSVAPRSRNSATFMSTGNRMLVTGKLDQNYVVTAHYERAYEKKDSV